MDDDIFYASDDRSSIELIEQEFRMSRTRSRFRHAYGPSSGILRADQILPAVAIVAVAILLLMLIKIASPL